MLSAGVASYTMLRKCISLHVVLTCMVIPTIFVSTVFYTLVLRRMEQTVCVRMYVAHTCEPFESFCTSAWNLLSINSIYSIIIIGNH
ncbi:hypothetical protein FKM82_010904 [Ascaphus truei]